jgi:hypothetical protein
MVLPSRTHGLLATSALLLAVALTGCGGPNPTGQQIMVVSAASSAARTDELHETAMVDGQMARRVRPGGFAVPARGSHRLAPGGDHLMLMDLTAPIRPGDEVTLTLTLAGGATVGFTAVGKDFAGGNESYHPGPAGSTSPMPGPETSPMPGSATGPTPSGY